MSLRRHADIADILRTLAAVVEFDYLDQAATGTEPIFQWTVQRAPTPVRRSFAHQQLDPESIVRQAVAHVGLGTPWSP